MLEQYFYKFNYHSGEKGMKLKTTPLGGKIIFWKKIPKK